MQNIKSYTLPLIAMRGKTVFPDAVLPIDAGRKETVQAIRQTPDYGMYVFITKQKDTSISEVRLDNLCEIGTISKVIKVDNLSQGILRIHAEGRSRARIREIQEKEGYFVAVVDEVLSEHGERLLEEAYFRTAKDMMREIERNDGKIAREIIARLDTCTDPDEYINIAMSALHIREEVKQEVLETTHVPTRLRLFDSCLNTELEITRLEKSISGTVRQNMEQNQKEYYLREQLRAIHQELGDDLSELDQLRDKIKAKGMPPETEEKALAEITRMSKMQTASPDYNVLRGYIDWMIDLPWKERTEDTESLAEAEGILEADHYGLEKVKERITEYLAVLKLTENMNAPILCLVGPPGVGKTSIAKSVARALGRKFVRMSLGGVHDEAEIRGHRKTYVGAIPGRILYGMKNAGSVNPVFLLDEIDKISSDMHGDPASALLEVLDPEQNSTFRDRYLEVPYDLSKVLFITTANTLDTIPGPLRDRMEIIELSGYTLEEKREIAKRYLVPKQSKAVGLPEGKLSFTDKGIDEIVSGYTMEAGVRNLERTIGTVCRKVAVAYAKDREMPETTITEENVETYLGAKRFLPDTAAEQDEVGAATGLAWTSVGGTTLTIEVATVKGNGKIILTGKLGDVMKESAQAALSFIRAHAESYGIDPEVFEKTDIHIHVPEGATPKDGPSAGITMATAILSAFTGKAVRKDIAMTGEITLRGKVLPIGGLKEKSLAARRIGIHDIIIPEENKKDIEEIPETLRGDLHFILASDVSTVFRNAIVGL